MIWIGNELFFIFKKLARLVASNEKGILFFQMIPLLMFAFVYLSRVSACGLHAILFVKANLLKNHFKF